MYTSEISYWIINTSVSLGLLVNFGLVLRIACGSVAFVGAVCDEDYFCDQVEIFNRNGIVSETSKLNYEGSPPIQDLVQEAS